MSQSNILQVKINEHLIWKFADQKVNVFGPAHIEKSHFKGVFECIIWQSFMKYRRE
jgi:hypothetical protein